MKYFNYKATFEHNKATYRALVKKHHPDKGGSKQTFLDIQNQWEFYKVTHKTADTSDKKQAFNEFADRANFTEVNDPVKFFEDNKAAIQAILNHVVFRRSNITEQQVNDGFKIAKFIFGLFK